jgi:hypothetical protein
MRTQRLTAALLGALIALAAGTALNGRRADAAGVPQVLRARSIELVDARGVRRASLKVEAQGSAVVFRMFDGQGLIRVKLGAGESGSGLVMDDETTEPGVHILATRERTMVAVQRGELRKELTP